VTRSWSHGGLGCRREKGIEPLYSRFERLAANASVHLVLAGPASTRRRPPPAGLRFHTSACCRTRRRLFFLGRSTSASVYLRDTPYGRYSFRRRRDGSLRHTVGRLRALGDGDVVCGPAAAAVRTDDAASLADCLASQLARPQIPNWRFRTGRSCVQMEEAYLKCLKGS